MRRLAIGAVCAALAFFALGLALVPLQSAAFTAYLSERHSQWAEAGLSADAMRALAERARLFVVAAEGELPAQVAGRPGFDAASVSHLADVHAVLRFANGVTVVLGLVLAGWFALALRSGRRRDVAAALIGGAVATLALLVAALVFASTDFESFFVAFHGLFFAQGTWTFPYDSLLIRLFPEPFWVEAGAWWGGLVALVAVAYAGAGAALLRGIRRAPSAD